MPDYKAMYFSMFHACEAAISLLIEAQRQCEERYLEETDEPLQFPTILPTASQDGPQPAP